MSITKICGIIMVACITICVIVVMIAFILHLITYFYIEHSDLNNLYQQYYEKKYSDKYKEDIRKRTQEIIYDLYVNEKEAKEKLKEIEQSDLKRKKEANNGNKV